MIVHTYKLNYKYGDVIKIKPIFDIHYGNTQCDVVQLKKDLSENPDAHIIGGGDWLDSIIWTDTKRYAKSSDATDSDDILDEQIDGLYKIFEPYKDKIIGCLAGNHCLQVSKRHQTNPMRRLCKKLDTTYLGYSSFIKLMLNENGARVRTIMFYLNHGFGGGRTLGADLTRYHQTMNYYDADAYCFGHSHQKLWTPVERIGVRGNKIVHDSRHLIVCGTYLRTLSDDTNSTYGEEKGYRPVSLGCLTVNIKPSNTFADIWVDR